MYHEQTILALFFTCQQEEAEFLCVGSKRKPSNRLIKGIVREGIFVTTITYCFCSNRTIVYCINKEWENSSMKWIISMTSWITVIFGTEWVSQLVIEIIHSIDEKEKNMIFRADKITRCRFKWWLIGSCLFFSTNEIIFS